MAEPELFEGLSSMSSLFANLGQWASTDQLQFSEQSTHQARLCFVDTLACLKAGSDQPAVRKVAAAMIQAGSTGTVGTVVPNVALSGPAAALVNGTAAHVLDYDDYEVPASTHPSAAIIPALLAANELAPSTYGQILSAYLVGYETIVRMGQALGGYGHYMAGWHSTSTVGPIGAAAAVARLYGMSSDNFIMAMAISCSQAAGLKAQFGTDTKPLHAGFAARCGLESALLAQAGMTANPNVLDGPYGFLACYNGEATGALAVDFSTNPTTSAMDKYTVLRKPWPSCAYTHRTIEAALKHTGKVGFAYKNVVRGTIKIPEPYFRVAPFLKPQVSPEARFSVLYCAVAALIDGELTPTSFSEPAICRPDVKDFMSRIDIDAYDAGPDLEDMSPDFPDSLTLHFKDGSEQTETVHHVKGGLDNLLSEMSIRKKFLLCGGASDTFDALMTCAPNHHIDIPLGS